jgi:dTDP-4-dehydrorhamnose reductase
MSTILILGARGQLGFEMALQLRELLPDAAIHALGREHCDITDTAQLDTVFSAHAPSLVINGAAYNAVDQAEDDRDGAIKLNALAPAHMAHLSALHRATFLHFSTDYVFGHGHDTPIDESFTPAPLSAYGRSKRLGEQLALQNNPGRTFVVRCCGLYGERRANFVRTMIRCALQGRALNVVSDQFISPTWVRPLAKACVALLKTDAAPHGIYHAVAQGQCSWFEYAAAIFEQLDLDADLSPVNQSDWGAKAPRPTYSVLDNAMLRLIGIEDLPEWRASLNAFLDEYGAQIIAEERAKLDA